MCFQSLLAVRSSARSACQDIYAGPWTGFAGLLLLDFETPSIWAGLCCAGWAVLRERGVEWKLSLQKEKGTHWEPCTSTDCWDTEITASIKPGIAGSVRKQRWNYWQKTPQTFNDVCLLSQEGRVFGQRGHPGLCHPLSELHFHNSELVFILLRKARRFG